MISVADLWTRLDSLASPLPAERAPLANALGRILRESVLAPEDQPPFDRSAVDGYLVRSGSPAGIHALAGTLFPGSPAPASPPPAGQAFRVLTGSALPPGSAVIMQEDTRLIPDGRVEFLTAPDARPVRRRASQARAGDTLLAAGSPISPGALALLASVGVTAPLVTRRPRVAHLVTGAELVPPETAPAPGQIRDSNSALIAALLAAFGADLVWHGRVSDSETDTAAALAAALVSEADIVLVSGGASVGDHDHTGALLAAAGFTIHCDKVASRPGKPFIAASRGPRLAFGLPGNPLSHFVCFHLFVRRALARLAGSPSPALVAAALAPDTALRPDPRETWWPAILAAGQVTPLPWRDSSDLNVLASANALLRVPSAAPAGAAVEVLSCLPQ